MKNKMKTIFLFIAILFLLPGGVNATIIFQDNFESDPSDWVCDNENWLSKWDDEGSDCHSEYGVYEWKMAQGHNSSNAISVWKRNILELSQFRGTEARKWFSGDELKTEIYHRWYMKIPPANQWDKSCDVGFKFWRYITQANGTSNPSVVYLNAFGSTFSTSHLAVYATADVSANGGWKTLVPVSEFEDNQWHSHELRMKYNSSNTAHDGVLQYWLDGVLRATVNNMYYSDDISTAKWYNVEVGIGNTTQEEPFDQTEWSAIAFDDIVVSTEYVGPTNSGDTTAPNSPTDLDVL